MEQPSNIEILKQFTLSQDEQIFAAIVERYVDRVFSAALRQLHDWHLAKEATQNVFLDLLKAAPKLPIQTEAQLRSAMSQLRRFGEKQIVQVLTKAVQRFKDSNDSDFPETMNELMPYLEPSYEKRIFNRWGILSKDEANGVVLGNDVFITQIEPVDKVFDMRYAIGPNGSGATEFLHQMINKTMKPVYQAYADSHNGTYPEDPDEYLPYVDNEAQKVAIEKLKLRNEVRTGF
jgi:hypothetical protein